jgi:hypothetical protein
MDLKEILRKHSLWLKGEVGGVRADLSGADLSSANLSSANLSGADLTRAYLSGANLSGANLPSADLSSANLSGANLSGADLSSANLSGADLSSANLTRAYLSSADLTRADLSSADLTRAYLSSANLTRAYLSSANLSGANLTRAYLSGARLPVFQICPEEGAFIAWKKTRSGVVKLLIPADAERTSTLVGRKCRASKAIVLEGFGQSLHNPSLSYEVGVTVLPDSYNGDIRIECTNGIHFFITKKEAEEYSL